MRSKTNKTIILIGILAIFFSSCTTAQTRRQDYVDDHPELDYEIKESILNGKIDLGMTKEQVIASWGHPVEINKISGPWGVYEQWVYYSNRASLHTCPIIFIYFDKGIVKSWGECG